MNGKKTIIISVAILLLAIVATVGASYAYFATVNKTSGNEKNLNIVTENLGDIKWEGTKVFTSGNLLPGECGIQTFTIEKNSATGKGVYEIDLKGIIDVAFNEDVEITLYKSTDTTNNNVTIKEGESTISGDVTKEYYKEDSVVLNGAPEKVYGTKALQNKDKIILEQADFDNSTLEKTTYYLVYCYKNNGNQDSQQGKSFSGEISVKLILDKITNLSEYVENVASDTRQDEAGNTRYIGADPDNYVKIDYDGDDNYIYRICSPVAGMCVGEFSTMDECKNELNNEDAANVEEYQISCLKKQKSEMWRIIGTMKDIYDGTGNKSDRVKLIRASSIGNYSWDTSEHTVNGGSGVNEWSQADLMKLLNPRYESESVGGSLYWNNQSGLCYNGWNNETTSCDFTSTGIKGKLKALIGDAVWNTGAPATTGQILSKFYIEERGNGNGKICSSGSYCNDTVERTTTWKGLVGLMYPSDYAYAENEAYENAIDSSKNLNVAMRSLESNSNFYYESNLLTSKANNWLLRYNATWTLTPMPNSNSASLVFSLFSEHSMDPTFARPVLSSGCDGNVCSFDHNAVFPTVYLLSSVKIVSGDGSTYNPFELSL